MPRLIYDASTKAEFEKKAVEITNRLWAVTDVESIMQTALEQLGKKLHASKGVIQLEMNNSELLDAPGRSPGHEKTRHTALYISRRSFWDVIPTYIYFMATG